MTLGYYWGPPGVGTARTATSRTIFLSRSETFLPQGRRIDGALSRDPGNTGDPGVLRPGLLMGKVTSGGKYANAIIDVSIGAVAQGAVSITVSAAGAVEIVRRLGATGTFTMTGPPAANGVVNSETVTYSAVNTTTGVITCTAIVNAYVSGSFIGPTDGSQNILSFIPDWDYALQVIDVDGNSISTVDFPKLPISGVIFSANLLPVWPSDTSLQTLIASRLRNVWGGAFVLDYAY